MSELARLDDRAPATAEVIDAEIMYGDEPATAALVDESQRPNRYGYTDAIWDLFDVLNEADPGTPEHTALLNASQHLLRRKTQRYPVTKS